MKDTINGADFKSMLQNAAVLVGRNKTVLNDLNVFPVPDGDTGTNMYLTLNHAVTEMAEFETARLTKMADKAAAMLLRGAHGNSGSITSLLFSGMAKHLKEKDEADAEGLALALRAGVDKAYSALMKPQGGTILSVARRSSETAVAKAGESADIADMLSAALDEARRELELTPKQNPVLAKAGVVDAGAKGFCYILEGFLAAVCGQILAPGSAAETAQNEKNIFGAFSGEDITFGYCTEFIINKTDGGQDTSAFTAFLDKRGDSVVTVDDGEIVKVHVHTDHPGQVIEEAFKYGALSAVKIDNMREQHGEKLGLAAAAPDEPDFAPAEKPFGFVPVAAGAGIVGVFTDLGADRIVEGGQTMNPSTEEILKNVHRTPAETVFVLPNNKNIIPTAELAAEVAEKRLVVIPSKSIPQGVAAMLVFDPEASEEENVAAMTAALSNVRTGQLTYAARDSAFDGHEIKQGDYIALNGGKLSFAGGDINEALDRLTDDLDIASASFITVFTGADATAGQSAELERLIRERCGRHAEITFVDGGQPVYYYVIGVE